VRTTDRSCAARITIVEARTLLLLAVILALSAAAPACSVREHDRRDGGRSYPLGGVRYRSTGAALEARVPVGSHVLCPVMRHRNVLDGSAGRPGHEGLPSPPTAGAGTT